MIEFMPCDGYTCEGDEECETPANVAIIEDGYWYFSATCPNEEHVAGAIQWHLDNRDHERPMDVHGLAVIP